MDNFPNHALFTNNYDIRAKYPWLTWYDGTMFYNGRGSRADTARIDMNLPKDIILNIIIPCCYDSKKVYIWNEILDNFKETTICDILKMLKN